MNESTGNAFSNHVKRWGLWRALYTSLMTRLSGSNGLFLAWVFRAELRPYDADPPPGLRVVLAGSEDLAAYLGVPGFNLSRTFVEDAWARGDVCVATYYQNQLAAYGWVAYRQAPHIHGLWVHFGPGHRYNYKSLTLPQFRGRHIRGSYGALAVRDHREGVSHSIAFIETHNYASISAEKRHGGQKVGFAGYFRIAGRTLTFSSPGAKRYGFFFATSPSDQAS